MLVVGAGASHDFEPEMGTGQLLLENILSRVNEVKETAYLTNILDGLKEKFKINITPFQRKAFFEKLSEYQQSKSVRYSIDDFLNTNLGQDGFWEIGTFSIAFHVLGYEEACLRKASFSVNSWLEELNEFIIQHRLNTWNDRLIDLKIVTLNYDRLLEEFLYRKHGQAISEFINKSIIHIYNKISPLPWQQNEMKNNQGFLMFGHPNNDEQRILDNKDNILLMFEQRMEKNLNLEPTKAAISSANSILFLGYGYDTYNNKNLGLTKLNGKRIFANYFIKEWNDKSKKEFEKFKADNAIWGNQRDGITFTTETCTDFIRHWLRKVAEL